jgi:carboxylesterase
MALARNGLDVEGIQLPGHGTRPEDLVGVTWDQWYTAAREALRAMRPRYDRIFVCGQSLGGSLALVLAAHEPVDGVISLAGVAYMRDWRFFFLPLIEKLRPWRRSPGNDIAKPGVRDIGSYDRMPLSALRQLLDVARQVRNDLPRVQAPALVVQSAVDHVVHTGNADYIHAHLGSRAKEIVRLQRSYHVISLDNDFDLVVDRVVRFVRKVGCARDPQAGTAAAQMSRR